MIEEVFSLLGIFGGENNDVFGQKGVEPTSSGCEKSKFDCDIEEMMIGRIILIVLYALVLGYAIFSIIFYRTRSLLFTFVGSLAVMSALRIILFSTPLYYTWKLSQKNEWGVLLLDILPEAMYFVSFFILLISYIFYVRAYGAIYRRREMSLYSSSTLVAEKKTMVSSWKKYSLFAGCTVFILLVVATSVGGIVMGLLTNGDTYKKDSPIADSIFIVILAAIFETVLIVVTVKHPYRIKTGVLTAIFPGIKAVISTYEWYIWELDRTTWLVLWVCYFLITELIPSVILITMIIRKSHKKKNQKYQQITQSDRSLLY